MSGFDMSKFREMFLEEAIDLFETVDELLLQAEESGELTSDEMNSLFRAIHTLKGSGASVELAQFAKFTHDLETLMDKLRNNELAYQVDMASLFMDCVDAMKNILDSEVDDSLEEDEYDSLTADLLVQLRGFSDNAPKPEAVVEAVPEVKEETTPVAPAQVQNSTSQVTSGNNEFGFFEEKNTTTEAFGFFDEKFQKTNVETQDEVIETPKEEVVETPVETPEPVEATPPPVEQKKEETAVVAKKTPSKKKDSGDKKSKMASGGSSIRVNLSKIDVLMNNIGELVITNAMLVQFADNLEDQKIKAAISERLELLDRHIRELQDSIMSIRMVPMESIYSKFPKVIRDTAKKLNKKIEFKHFGDSVEIDKAMIEGLTDPLVHIIRNSLDHGIEMPDVRKAAGKDETGLITINAEQANGQIIISIVDDGGGVNVERVASKALEKEIISQNEYETMSINEKAMLIFAAGLSTADKVSDISGRGVGMDVVKTNINKLGGVIKLDTKPSIGTTMTIILPLTLAILDGLDISVGEEKYILPLAAIVESLQPIDDMIKKVGNGSAELLMLREEFIPIVRLHKLFNKKSKYTELNEGMLVVVKSGTSKIALFVDEFLNQQQVVVKPLDKNFKNIRGVSGATVRGDGTIGLILDVLGIIEEQKRYEERLF